MPRKLTSQKEAMKMKRIAPFLLLFGIVMNLTACSDTVSWQEEVKMNDRRVIVVSQKKRCESAYTGQNYASCIAREAWLTISLPEFGGREIVWHENLDPRVVNVHDGKLYIVGFPPTQREFNNYGRPNHPYLGFLWDQGMWKPIPFQDIPEEIYNTNMLIESIPPTGTSYLTLSRKNELNNEPGYSAEQKRISPRYHGRFF